MVLEPGLLLFFLRGRGGEGVRGLVVLGFRVDTFFKEGFRLRGLGFKVVSLPPLPDSTTTADKTPSTTMTTIHPATTSTMNHVLYNILLLSLKIHISKLASVSRSLST